MKKILSVLLCLIMLFSLFGLAACSDNSGGASSGANTSGAASSADSGTANQAPADSAEPEKTASDGGGASGIEPIKLQTATSYNTNDFNGQLVAWFIDYLYDNSDGAIEISCYYGGSFCADAEVYDYVMAGELQLSFVQPVYAMTYFPYSFGLAGYEDNQETVDILMGIIHENPETAALLDEQGAENNLKLLGHTSAGCSIFLSKKEIVSFEDAAQYTIGSPINLDIYASYGFGTVAIEPADMYDSLSRGVCDMVAYAAANALSQKLYEVAPHVGDPGAYFSNQMICLNREVWDSLSTEAQELFIEAAYAVKDYSVQLVEEMEQELFFTVIPENNGTYNKFTLEEAKEFNHISMVSTSNMLRNFAGNINCSEGMEVIIKAWADGLKQEMF